MRIAKCVACGCEFDIPDAVKKGDFGICTICGVIFKISLNDEFKVVSDVELMTTLRDDINSYLNLKCLQMHILVKIRDERLAKEN
jgi:hypothetical protein